MYDLSPITTTNLWDQSLGYKPPCTYYTFDAKSTMQQKGLKKGFYLDGSSLETTAEGMTLTFKSRMDVTEQFWSYGLLAYVAENGGFVGLFLGYSVLQFRDVVIEVCLRLKGTLRNK